MKNLLSDNDIATDVEVRHSSPSEVEKIRGNLWPIPTLSVSLPSPERFNAALSRIILDEEQRILRESKPVTVAGVADGLTAHWLWYNVLNWKYPEIIEFRRFVLDGFNEWLRAVGDPSDPKLKITGISCWANVLRHGEKLAVHHHDPAFVSAHYTVQSGNDDTVPARVLDSGYTVYFRPGFIDRSHGGDAALAGSPWDADWRIETPPTPGRLFFFPSFIRHEVRPYLGSSYRISIALDVFVAQQRLPMHFGGPRWFVPR
jgi:Putative 2OG-Fe(II) oxygenase